MSRILTGLLALVLLTSASLAQSAGGKEIPKIKQTKLGLYLTPQEAAAILKAEGAKTLFIDVRTRSELQFVGWTPLVDANVPFVDVTEFWDWDDKNNRYKLDANPTFSKEIGDRLAKKGLSKSDRIILMCRSGDRSARAIDALHEAGYTNVWNQFEGFEGDMSKETKRRDVNGWRNAGLPSSFELDKTKMPIKAN
jgi:rhodanese-related sulfurtransferase